MRTDHQPRCLQARIAKFAALVSLVLTGLCATATATAQVSYIRPWGWGVRVTDGANRLDEFGTGAIPGGLASPCAPRQLVISLGRLSAASGHLAVPIRFHDIGGACSLRGFPRVDGLSVSGRVIIRAKQALAGYFGRWRVATVALKRGETASAVLEGLDPAFLSRPPRSSERFRITAPNVSNGVRRRTSLPLCRLIIHPVVLGLNGGGR